MNNNIIVFVLPLIITELMALMIYQQLKPNVKRA